jgi:hypothetical protein
MVAFTKVIDPMRHTWLLGEIVAVGPKPLNISHSVQTGRSWTGTILIFGGVDIAGTARAIAIGFFLITAV